MDFRQAEDRFRGDLAVCADPDPSGGFDRDWARDLTARVIAQLKSAYATQKESGLYQVLFSFLTVEAPAGTYEQLAKTMNITVNNIRVAVHRLRRDFGRQLREAVAETVARPEDVDDELRNLLATLGRP
jgi:hypothetical protein